VTVAAAQFQSTPLLSVLGIHGDALAYLPEDSYSTPYGVSWLAMAVVGVALAGLAWSAVRGNRLARALGLAAGVLIAMVILLPADLETFYMVRSRFATLACVLVLVGGGLSVPNSHPRRGLLSALVLALSIGASIGFYDTDRHLADVYRQYTEGIGEVETGPRRLVFRPGSPSFVGDDLHMGANLHVFYMMEEDAVFPILFLDESDRSFVASGANWQTFERARPEEARGWSQVLQWELDARDGLRFDEAMLWAPERLQLNVFAEHGYAAGFENEYLYRLIPPVRVLAFEIVSERTQPLVVPVLFGRLTFPYAVVPVKLSEDMRFEGRFLHLPARRVRVVVFSPDEPGNPRAEIEVDLTDGDGSVTLEVR
jgi:hypothetical protein